MILSGKYDKKKALEQTLTLWNEIAENPQMNKFFALKALCMDTDMFCHCPICEYTVIVYGFDFSKGFLFADCEHCPVEWKEVNKVDSKRTQPCVKSYFGLWVDTYSKYMETKDEKLLNSLKLYAIRIASIMEDKLDELESNQK